MNLAELGFTREELQDRVVQRIAEQVMTGVTLDENDEPREHDSHFARRLNEAVRKRVDEAIDAIAKQHVLPNVTAYIENITLTETNKWGERTGNPMTFVEYLAARADAYLKETVDYDGKSKDEKHDAYGWRGTQTRITALVHQHLHFSIESAMKDAVKSANQVIAGGIAETVKQKLAEITSALSVTVKTK